MTSFSWQRNCWMLPFQLQGNIFCRVHFVNRSGLFYDRIPKDMSCMWHSQITCLNQSCSIPVSTYFFRSCIWPLSFLIKLSVKYLILKAHNLIDESFSSSSLVMYVFSTPVIRHVFAGFYIWLWSYYFLNINYVCDCFWFLSYIWLYWH